MGEINDSRTVPRIMAAAEVIGLLGVSTARAHQLMKSADFPAPIATLRVGKIWLAEDVEAWELNRQAEMKERQAR